MSMSLALEYTRNWLQGLNSSTCDIRWGDGTVKLNKDTCYLGWGGRPQHITNQFCIVLDDGGVAATQPENYFQSETYTLLVYVWRRTGRYSEDRLGQQMYISDDLYTTYAKSLEKLERDIIVNLHNNYTMLTWVNAAGQANLPTEANGDAFLNPWNYRGRGENEVFAMDEENSWLGRSLRFDGFLRIQKQGDAQ